MQRLIPKRGWHVKAGMADSHPLTKLQNRPVGATTSWLHHREYRSARSAAVSLIHVLGNHMDKLPFVTKGDLRVDELGEAAAYSEVRIQQENGRLWLAAEVFCYGGAYVVVAREGMMMEEWSGFASLMHQVRRGTLTPEIYHRRYYLKT